MILDYGFLRTRDIAQILKKPKEEKKNKKHRWGGVTETVASYSVIKLHFRRSIYIVSY